MIIEKLVGRSGNVRDILGVPAKFQLDISNDRWDESKEVMECLIFEGVLLRDAKISPDFIECQFLNCDFSGLKSYAHFWGSSNLWNSCKFSNLQLIDVISAQNRFVNCKFDSVVLRKYQPCETVFIGCTFNNLLIEGMNVLPNNRNKMIRKRMAELWEYPEIKELDKTRLSLLFRDCHFSKPSFMRCHFLYSSFDNSTFEAPSSSGCSFDGLIGENNWWYVESSDPEIQYMNELLDLADERLGPDSWVRSKLVKYMEEYNGKHLTGDWLEYLIENGIPDEQYEIIDRIINILDRKFT